MVRSRSGWERDLLIGWKAMDSQLLGNIQLSFSHHVRLFCRDYIEPARKSKKREKMDFFWRCLTTDTSFLIHIPNIKGQHLSVPSIPVAWGLLILQRPTLGSDPGAIQQRSLWLSYILHQKFSLKSLNCRVKMRENVQREKDFQRKQAQRDFSIAISLLIFCLLGHFSQSTSRTETPLKWRKEEGI